ncbi:MAG: NAD(P)H-dependent oxidoreductase [Alphaproteobacteria bacterium]
MKRILIIWHSRTGTARAMAEAAAEGARREPDIEVRLVTAEAATAADLLAAQAYLFAGPETLAALSGEMKAMFDRTYYDVLDQLNARPYGHLIAAGSDGTGAARQLARIVTGWRLKPIAEPVIHCTHAQTAEAIIATKHMISWSLKPCHDLGAALAAGLALGIF